MEYVFCGIIVAVVIILGVVVFFKAKKRIPVNLLFL